MTTKAKHNLKGILHPYQFILKEGGEIKKDFLDYSLMMLMVNSTETIKSPKGQKRNLSDIVPDMDMAKITIPAYLGDGDSFMADEF